MTKCISLAVLCLSAGLDSAIAFVAPLAQSTSRHERVPLFATSNADRADDFESARNDMQRENLNEHNGRSRRALLQGFIGGAAAVAWTGIGRSDGPLSSAAYAADEIEFTPFNGLIFNYRNSDKYVGLKASDLGDTPSVPFPEFLDKLTAGDVAYVEFLAPHGDEAYASFKAKEGEQPSAPIRIGEGYPIEQGDGWSSPAFVVRAVKEKSVPYKFVVPGLTANRQ